MKKKHPVFHCTYCDEDIQDELEFEIHVHTVFHQNAVATFRNIPITSTEQPINEDSDNEVNASNDDYEEVTNIFLFHIC
jgi:hypothetical protein